MKRLILLRHAKAVAKTAPDRARALSPDGIAQMGRVAELLPREGLRPALALVSPAVRTRETWDLARAGLGEVAARFEERIYAGDVAALVTLIREQADAADPLILVGHNPTIHELAFWLLGSGDRDALAPPLDFPTAAVAVLDLDVSSWTATVPERGRLASFTAPDAMG